MLSPEELLAIKASVPDGVAAACARLVIATLLGGTVGVNRELRQKPAGFRTHAMVALGAALLMLIALSLGDSGAAYDTAAVSRVLQGVIAGIGFIGGGAILRQENAQNVHGLTTATSIWIVAAVGVAAGLGLWPAAVAAVLIAMLVLTIGEFVDRTLLRLRARVDKRTP